MVATLRTRTVAAPVFDYGNCPSSTRLQPTHFHTDADHRLIINGAHIARKTPYTPRNIESIEFNPSDWTDAEKPWNVITSRWSVDDKSKRWSPPSVSVVLNTEVDETGVTRLKLRNFYRKNNYVTPGEPRCLGKWCWQQTKPIGDFLCEPNAKGLACDHKLSQWMQGCADWQDRIELRPATVDGMGIAAFSKVAWSKDDILGPYLGKLIPKKTDNTDYCQQIKIGAAFGSNTPQEVAYVDAEERGTWTRFVNHDCLNNTHFVEEKVGSLRILALAATRDIRAGDQITADYQAEYFLHRQCLCGAGAKCKYPKEHNPIEEATPSKKRKMRDDDDDFMPGDPTGKKLKSKSRSKSPKGPLSKKNTPKKTTSTEKTATPNKKK
jgi:hypothetical protein